jgi:CDP-paratose 2-epimerase
LKKKIIIIGGCGFIGLNVLEFLFKKKLKADFVVIDNLKGASSKKNLLILKKNFSEVKFFKTDVSNLAAINALIKRIKPNIILGLHGQVAVTKSIINPCYDFKSNFLSIFNILEVLRKLSSRALFISLSSNKVYGSNTNSLVDEKFPLEFTSPYACSKGAADQYVIDYAKNFKLNCLSLRLSCIYGQNQWGTEDQGWISWFVKRILEDQNIRLFGNGKQIRDILHVDDLSRLILIIIRSKKKCSGNAFNVGGGLKNSISLIGLIKKVESILHKKAKKSFHPSRYGDQKYFINNLNKIYRYTKWKPKISITKGLKSYINWCQKNNLNE